MCNETLDKICFEKVDVLKSMERKRVEVRLIADNLNMLARGILRYNRKTSQWYVQQSGTGDVVVTFSEQCLENIVLGKNIIRISE